MMKPLRQEIQSNMYRTCMRDRLTGNDTTFFYGESFPTDESLLPPSASPQSSGSGWSRARAKSYPPSQHSATQTMLQLPRPEPVVVEEAGDDGSEVEDKVTGGVSGARSGVQATTPYMPCSCSIHMLAC